MGWTQPKAGASVLLALALQREKAGKRITAMLAEKDWTHENLAHESGVSVKTVSRIANGKHDARKDTRDRIAKALGTTSDDIWDKPAPLGLGLEDPYQAQIAGLEAKVAALTKAVSAMHAELAGAVAENQRVLTSLADQRLKSAPAASGRKSRPAAASR